MRPGLTLAAVLALISLAAPAAARADTFDYSYTGSLGGTTFTFNYDSSTPIPTSYASILSASASNCSITGPNTPVCESVTLIPADTEIQIDYSQVIDGFMLQPTLADFGSADLFTVGTHMTTYGTLTVTDIPDVVPTPEPSSVVLLGTGLLGLAGVARRRLFS